MAKLLKMSFGQKGKKGEVETIQTSARGYEVLHNPFLNKGTAFTDEEREALSLTGLVPDGSTSLANQVARCYEQYRACTSDIEKNVYLTELRDRNTVLFYKLLCTHIKEMMPIVYDPTVGVAIERFSHLYHQSRGVFLSIDTPHRIEESFTHFGLSASEVDLIVVTDAEEILGIGDWGVGGMDIAIGKLAVYTAVAGIHPSRVIPVVLDVGTNNQALLHDPLYMGTRHTRVQGEKYDGFVETFVNTVKRLFPKALLHWEDFGPSNGRRILQKYRNKLPTFNDDMQGTGAITLSAVINALKVAKKKISECKVVILGAGTAGVGIADQLRDAMVKEGLTPDKATQQFWLVDKQGLLTDNMQNMLRDFQKPYARSISEVSAWVRQTHTDQITLEDVVANVHPTILIGTSTAKGAFHESLIKDMAKHVERPIIFPLSNPTPLAEAVPEDLIRWTEGRALVATGSPFLPVEFQGTTFTIGQANNALLYPGLGLGTIVAQATHISDGMLWAAAQAVAQCTTLQGKGGSLLPAIDDLREVSAQVAIAVVNQAAKEGLALATLTDVEQQVQQAMWDPNYPEIQAI